MARITGRPSPGMPYQPGQQQQRPQQTGAQSAREAASAGALDPGLVRDEIDRIGDSIEDLRRAVQEGSRLPAGGVPGGTAPDRIKLGLARLEPDLERLEAQLNAIRTKLNALAG